ncbi:MAG: response regulator transcription factor, partial [Gaiellaceae bacterium]
MTTVLVVDDEPLVRDVVTRYLERDGHRVLTAEDGDAARGLIERERLSLVLLDVMLPGEDGLALCRWIRSSSELPVILLTARVDEADRIVGLELGADDYVTKPYSTRELLARIRAVLRRRIEVEDFDEAILEGGRVRMDVDRHTVEVDGEPVPMPLKEFELLELLMRNPGRVLT